MSEYRKRNSWARKQTEILLTNHSSHSAIDGCKHYLIQLQTANDRVVCSLMCHEQVGRPDR